MAWGGGQLGVGAVAVAREALRLAELGTVGWSGPDSSVGGYAGSGSGSEGLVLGGLTLADNGIGMLAGGR